MTTTHTPLTRAKEQIHGDEEAGTELKLGEFQNVSSLTLSETKEVLTAVFNHRREQGKFKVPDNEYVTTRTPPPSPPPSPPEWKQLTLGVCGRWFTE